MAHKILRLRSVTARTELSRSCIYRFVTLGKFPKPIRLGPRAVGWLEAEVEAWIEKRIAESRTGA